MNEPTPRRIEELSTLVELELNDQPYFDYSQWDHLIEDGQMTDEELDWLREHATIYVSVGIDD